jgi:hypothetical protein
MAEAEELCDRIAVIAGGEIQALGTADELKHHAEGRRVLEVQAFGVSDEQLAGIDVLPGVREASVEVAGTAQLLTIQSDATVDVQADVLRALDGVRLGRVTARQPTLEDAYIAIVNGSTAHPRRCPHEANAAGRAGHPAARQAAQPVAVRDRHRAVRPAGPGDPRGLPVPRGTVGVLVSHVTMLVGACVAGGLALAALARRQWRHSIEAAITGLAMLCVFGAAYLGLVRGADSDTMVSFWGGRLALRRSRGALVAGVLVVAVLGGYAYRTADWFRFDGDERGLPVRSRRPWTTFGSRSRMSGHIAAPATSSWSAAPRRTASRSSGRSGRDTASTGRPRSAGSPRTPTDRSWWRPKTTRRASTATS